MTYLTRDQILSHISMIQGFCDEHKNTLQVTNGTISLHFIYTKEFRSPREYTVFLQKKQVN